MKKAKTIAILGLLAVFLFSCKKRLPASDYVNWFKTSEENLNSAKTGNFIYEARYVSPDANALIEFGADEDSLKKYEKEFSQWVNFNLKIFAKEKDKDVLKYNIRNQQEYFERMQYLISYLNQDVKLLMKNKDTMHCAFHHYERTYNVTPFANISLSFEGRIEDADKLIIRLPFDERPAIINIQEQTYPELKL